MRLYLTLIFFWLLSTTAPAQLVMKGWEAGAWAGASFYLGDLNTDFRFNRPNPAGGLVLRYNFNHRLAIKGSGSYGRVEARDSDSENTFERQRNLSFRSRIIDATGQVEFNFLPYYHGSYEYFFTPYAFAGASVFNFTPKARLPGGDYVNLQVLQTENVAYQEFAIALTYGIGIKWDLSYEWSMDAHVGVRNVSTDYLDDVSDRYPDLASLDELTRRLSDRSVEVPVQGDRVDLSGTQRGDPNSNDRYIFLGLGLNYYFGDVRCPTIEKGRDRRRYKRNRPRRFKRKR